MAEFGYLLGIPRRKKYQLRKCHHQLDLWAYLWGINCWLTWEGPAHCERYHPWAGRPGLFGKVPEQAKGRGQEALFRHSFCFKLLLWVFPQWWPATQKPNEPFSSHVDFGHGVYHSNIQQPGTVVLSGNHLLPLHADHEARWRRCWGENSGAPVLSSQTGMNSRFRATYQSREQEHKVEQIKTTGS